MSEIKIAEWIGGSHLYGLETKDSDWDERLIFKEEDCLRNFGILSPNMTKQRTREGNDLIERNLLHFVRLLLHGNPEALEVIFIPEYRFQYLSGDFFDFFLFNPIIWVDSMAFFNSLRGYAKNEFATCFGIKKRRRAGSRLDLINKYGFSPKNLVQALRILNMGVEFFKSGHIYPTISDYDEEFADYLLEIKTNPRDFDPEDLMIHFDNLDNTLFEEFEKSKFAACKPQMNSVRLAISKMYEEWEI